MGCGCKNKGNVAPPDTTTSGTTNQQSTNTNGIYPKCYQENGSKVLQSKKIIL